MPANQPKLEWCVVRLGDDLNWWVTEISDEIHWDVDGLGILDPRQISHAIEACEPLSDYGFDAAQFDSAFYRFRIEKELEDGQIRLTRVRESLLDTEEPLFALPDIIDEEKGPYADLVTAATRLRVKMLNEQIDFKQNLTVDELEEEIRERQSMDYMEGRGSHVFTELNAILEYVPDGYELEEEDAVESDDDDEIADVDIPDLDEEEKIEEDETMKWDEEEEDEDESYDETEESDEDEDKS